MVVNKNIGGLPNNTLVAINSVLAHIKSKIIIIFYDPIWIQWRLGVGKMHILLQR